MRGLNRLNRDEVVETPYYHISRRRIQLQFLSRSALKSGQETSIDCHLDLFCQPLFYMAVGSGPAGPVLAGPIILKVSNDHIAVTRKLNLFLRKSIKLLPPELLLLAQICTESFVGWGFVPDPTEGAYSAPPPRSRSWIKGPTSKGNGGNGKEGEGSDF